MMTGVSSVLGGSAVFCPSRHQDSCKICVASQKGAASSRTSWAGSELMAAPHLQPVQHQPAAASHHATGSQGAGRGRVSREQRQEEDCCESQECSSAPVPLPSTGEALRHKLRGVTRVWLG